MIEKLLKEHTDDTVIQLVRYTFTGSIAVIIDFYCFFILVHAFNVHYLISAAFAYLIGIFVNYYLSSLWVFNKKPNNNFWIDFGLFTLIGLIGLLLVEIFMWFFTEIVVWYYFVSKITATILVSLWNFFARKHFIFSLNEEWVDNNDIIDNI